ncbi:MAG: NlpC/P60 family [Gaiellales bacterium]|jgi:cell wall-associated NlpC family hydrolase|nr:NlpC/P60 family [Gaiellales bacterium]
MAYTLNRRQRVEARNIILQAARKMLAHEDAIHYTQGARRWQGLDKGLRVVKGEFPKYADCSSITTWMLWNALTHAKRDLTIPDVVNGQHWDAGYTGTQRAHGKVVTGHLIVGDLVHYGPGTGAHVAMYIGGGKVFSHGSENGPYKLPVHYRGDYSHARRYIRAR